jgi:hypothetical protein
MPIVRSSTAGATRPIRAVASALCDMQDGPALNQTSSKRGSRLSTTFQRRHDRLDAARDDSRSADLDRPRSANVPAIVGLVALTAVTSWVVARVSAWLVPVYMSAMVLIFAAPRTSRPKAAATVPEGPSTAPGAGDEPTPEGDATGPSAAPVLVEPTAGVDDVAAAPPKPRKRRAKGRRSTKAAAAAAAAGAADPAAAQVTWIRVGPGKFVRADVQDPEAEGPPPPASPPEADASAGEIPADSPNPDDGKPGAEDAPEEPGFSDVPEVLDASEAIAEEHGNAPSTLGEGHEVVDDLEDTPAEPPGSFDLPEPPETPEVFAEEHGNAPSTLGEGDEVADHPDEADREDSRPELVDPPAAEPAAEAEPVATSVAPIASISTSTPATPDEPSSRPTRPPVLLDSPAVKGSRLLPVGPVVASGRLRNVRRGKAPRHATVSGRTADVRLRQRAARIRGRRIHVQRDYHPRSPPARA